MPLSPTRRSLYVFGERAIHGDSWLAEYVQIARELVPLKLT